MFVLSQQDSVAYRAIAMLAAAALVLWGIGVHVNTAQAANLTDVSNTLSDSDPSALSNHEIAFTIPTGSPGIDAAAEQIVVTFPTGFADGGVLFTDVDIEINTTDQTIVDGLAPAANQWGFDLTGQVLTLESGGGTAIATGTDDVVIKVGTNADSGVNQFSNPGATTSYEFVITVAGSQDTGKTQVAIIENVVVTAEVATTFEFLVSGFDSIGTAVNGTSTTGTSSSVALPFGVLSAGVTETLAQRLNVTTNAIQGYVVTVEQDQDLRSSTGAVIDGFIDGAYTNTPTSWDANFPSNDVNDPTTWGHFGLTSTDDLNTDEFAAGGYISASTTPRAIMSHTGPADGTTNDIGSSTIGYQVHITPLQEAADDYTTTLTYIATPTF